MAKTFFQIYEQASRHKMNKILREGLGDNPAAAAQGQTANAQDVNAPKQTAAPEMSDEQLMNNLSAAWTKFATDNQAAIKKLGELPTGKNLATTFNSMPGEMKKILASFQQQKQAQAKPTATSPTAGTTAAPMTGTGTGNAAANMAGS